MRSFTVEERRRRLGRRHRLLAPAPDVESVVASLVVLHATDPATVYLSAVARLAEPSLDAVAAALYDDRSLVRVLAMRRTLFVIAVDDLPMIERSSTDAVASSERKRLEGFLADTGIADPAGWLAAAADDVVAAMPDDGAPARELTTLVPRLATKIVMGAGRKHSATAGATSRTLAVLANEGQLVRGRPAGAWTGRQYRWYRRDRWLGPAEPDPGSLSTANASRLLVERWLRRFGPATYDDLKWWTGWRAGQVRAALAPLDVTEVDLHGETGLALTDDLGADEPGGDDEPGDDHEPSGGDEPWAALLPSLDPTPMGWKGRDWFLGPHRAPLFDRSGNIGPTVWLDGRIVGGWGQRSDGEIVTALLEEIGSDAEALVSAEVARLQAVIGETVVKPSFPTPLQKELAGS